MSSSFEDTDCKGYTLVVAWVTLNLALNFLNKWALSPLDTTLSWGGSLIRESVHRPMSGAGFSFPLFYSMCHMVASFIGASLIFVISPSTNRLSLKQLKTHGPALCLLSVLFATNIAGNNASLVTLGLAVNQLVKSVTPLPSMLFAFALERRTFPGDVVAAVLLLTASAAASIPWGSAAADTQGILLASTSMLAAAAKPALASCMGRDLRRDGLTPLVLVWYDSLFATLLTGALCVVSAERDGLRAYFASKPGLAAAVVASSSLLAFAYNLVVYNLTKAASPVVSVVASNFKQVILIVVAGIFVDRISHPLNWVGIGFFFFATFLYSYLALTRREPSVRGRERGHHKHSGGRGGGGEQPAPAPATAVRWSHKGIVVDATTESTPLRGADAPPQTPWYASGGRGGGSKKGSKSVKFGSGSQGVV